MTYVITFALLALVGVLLLRAVVRFVEGYVTAPDRTRYVAEAARRPVIFAGVIGVLCTLVNLGDLLGSPTGGEFGRTLSWAVFTGVCVAVVIGLTHVAQGRGHVTTPPGHAGPSRDWRTG